MKEGRELFYNSKISHQCYIRIKGIYETLKPAQKKAMDYLLDDPEGFSESSIDEVAKKAGCSQATIVRLAKSLGYSGYSELKNSILNIGYETMPLYQNISISKNDSINEITNKVFMSTIQALEDTLHVLDRDNFTNAVEALIKAGKIIFVGAGDASCVAQVGYFKFCRIGANVLYSPDYDNQLIIASQLKKGDVLIAISHSGQTKSTLLAMEGAKNSGATVVAITNYPISPIGNCADILLTTANFENDITGEIMAKRIPALCIIESLYTNALMRLDVERQDIASYPRNILSYNKK